MTPVSNTGTVARGGRQASSAVAPDSGPAVAQDSDPAVGPAGSSVRKREAVPAYSQRHETIFRFRSDTFWLTFLVVLTVLPRLCFLLRGLPLTDDAFYYLAVAQAYEQGEYRQMLFYLNVNIFPVLLSWLGSLGGDMAFNARLWSLLASALTILPLFGFIRRIYGHAAAVGGCALFAVHPEFIELGVEPIRDATFWLLSVTSIYLMYRAADERRWWLYAAFGVFMTLAVHTRTEGWIFAVLAVCWTLAWGRDSLRDWKRVTFGAATIAAAIPLFLVLFNVTVLADHDRWEWGRLEHFRLALQSATSSGGLSERTDPVASPVSESAVSESAVSEPPSAAGTLLPDAPGVQFVSVTASGPRVVPQSPPTLETVAPHLVEKMASDIEPIREQSAYEYLDSLVQTLKPFALLLMLAGVVANWRMMSSLRHQTLTVIVGLILLAIWLRLQTMGEINGRYFLFAYFPSAGAAGVGMIWLWQSLRQLARKLPLERLPVRVSRTGFAATIFSVLLLIHAAEAMDTYHPSRDRDQKLGSSLANLVRPHDEVLTLRAAARVGYFAGGRLPHMILDNTPIEELIDEYRPALIVLEHETTPRKDCANLTIRLLARGFQPYPISGLPGEERFIVLTASDRLSNWDPKQFGRLADGDHQNSNRTRR